MTTTRRDFLGTAAAAVGWTLLPSGLAVASTDLGGGATLQTVSDGQMLFGIDVQFGNLDLAKVTEVMASRGVDTKTSVRACNVTLMRANGRTVLFDAGAGSDFLPTTGKLSDTLDEIGVGAEEITDVIFTHAHPDHLWGLLDDFDDLRFPNADYYLGQKEWDYWTDPSLVDRSPEDLKTFAVGAARRLDILKDRINLFEGGAVLPGGAVAVEAFGHTPGHMAFRVGSDGTMLIADTVTDDVVNLAKPAWPARMDVDMDAGIATRTRLLDMAATDGFRIVGFHITRGGIGRIERLGDGYVFTPEV